TGTLLGDGRIDKAGELFIPKSCDAPEFLRNLVQAGLVNVGVRPDGNLVVLDVYQEVNLVLAAGGHGSFADKSTEVEIVVLRVLIFVPQPDKDGCSRNLAFHLLWRGFLGSNEGQLCKGLVLLKSLWGLPKAMLVLFHTSIRQLAPVNAAPVNLLHGH